MSDDKTTKPAAKPVAAKPEAKPTTPTTPTKTAERPAGVTPAAQPEAKASAEMTFEEGMERVRKLGNTTAENLFRFWTQNGKSVKETVRMLAAEFKK